MVPYVLSVVVIFSTVAHGFSPMVQNKGINGDNAYKCTLEGLCFMGEAGRKKLVDCKVCVNESVIVKEMPLIEYINEADCKGNIKSYRQSMDAVDDILSEICCKDDKERECVFQYIVKTFMDKITETCNTDPKLCDAFRDGVNCILSELDKIREETDGCPMDRSKDKPYCNCDKY